MSNNTKAINFVRRLIQRKNKKGVKYASTHSVISLFNRVLEHRENLEEILRYYPNGPLFKVLDSLSLAYQQLEFDPYLQDDIPQTQYSLVLKGHKVDCLHMACPTRQANIEKAHILSEFKGFLRHMVASRKNERVLLFNYQDRTCFKEYARSDIMERYQKDAEISEVLYIVTLPKKTDFYLQSEVYLSEDSAEEFLALLISQIKDSVACGFFFASSLDIKAILQFSSKCAKLVLKYFFANKKVLSRKNRLDFIEIFYQFLQMKIVDMIDPSVIGFMAKDSIDYSSTAMCGFYAFFKLLLEKTPFKEESDDDFLEMLFLPALLIRERGIDVQAISRLMSFLSITASDIQVNRTKLLKDLKTLFGFELEKDINIVRKVA